ncbi:unnamed protein product, partial [Meganyctiphanes norvegica]
RNLHQDLCHGQLGLCKAMDPIDGKLLLDYLQKVNFRGLSGDNFKFDALGDGPTRYNIIHYKLVSPGKYGWVTVGDYLDGQLNLRRNEIQYSLDHPANPESVCSHPCLEGQAKKLIMGEICCWHCFNCSVYEFVNASDENNCKSCPIFQLPSDNHSHCIHIPEAYIQPDSLLAIGAMAFASVGVLITSLVIIVFVMYGDTPIVRASGKELSYVLLSGVFLCYGCTFIFMLKPTDTVCGLQRFGLGFCFAVIYSALLTKTNRISRIFNAGSSNKRPAFISPRSQLFICSIAVLMQVVVTVLWCMTSPPRAIHHWIQREDNVLVCAASINASYMIAFAYPILLIGVCTIYAFLTRKMPEAFNESKHIGFTMYTTCIIWLAFVPIYFSTANNVQLRITTTAVSISLSATVALVFLYLPKIYIILLHPERNVRQTISKLTKKLPHSKSHLLTTCQMKESATQSEVVFPIDFEFQERLRNISDCGEITHRVTVSTQTSTKETHHTTNSNDKSMSHSRSNSITQPSGPTKDVPDINL